MKTIIIKLLMLTAVLSASTNIYAYDFEEDGIYYDITSSTEKTVEVTYRDYKYGSYSGDIVIPKQVSLSYNNSTYSVTSIGNSAFRYCSGLTSVTIPNSVTSIENSAFEDCSGLTSVTIGNSVTSIGNFAFSGCSGLTSVTIPNGVTTIGDSAFNGCSGLTSVTIPNSVTSIEDSAFKGCTNIKELVIEDGEKILGLGCNTDPGSDGDGLFYDCPLKTVYLGRNLKFPTYSGNSPFYSTQITNLTISDAVTSIETNSFSGCNSLKSVTIPESVTTIGDSAFSDCSSLDDLIIEDGKEILNFGTLPFENSPLKTVYLGRNLKFPTYSGNSPFYSTQITNLTISDAVTSIETNSFSGCNSLKSVTIPESVTTIGDSAFSGCI